MSDAQHGDGSKTPQNSPEASPNAAPSNAIDDWKAKEAAYGQEIAKLLADKKIDGHEARYRLERFDNDHLVSLNAADQAKKRAAAVARIGAQDHGETAAQPATSENRSTHGQARGVISPELTARADMVSQNRAANLRFMESNARMEQTRSDAKSEATAEEKSGDRLSFFEERQPHRADFNALKTEHAQSTPSYDDGDKNKNTRQGQSLPFFEDRNPDTERSR